MIAGIARLLFRIAIFLGLTVILVIAGVSLWFHEASQQKGRVTTDILFYVPAGSSHQQIRQTMIDENIISHPVYYAAMRLSFALLDGASFAPKAGEFLLPAGASLHDVFVIIDEGKAYQHRFLVTEGTASLDIIRQLNREEKLSGKIASIPAEGSLAADTYFFVRDESRENLVSRMQKAQELILAEEWALRQPGLPYQSPKEALIMASIIEKETGIIDEQPLVSSVFINRLRKKMRLQSDATTLYGIIQNEGRARTIRKSDLTEKTKWNTYRIDGLPPTAIGNPGRAAIKAALNPVPSRYFYFVANGKGGHNFAKTLAEHNKNVQAYRAIMKNQKDGKE